MPAVVAREVCIVCLWSLAIRGSMGWLELALGGGERGCAAALPVLSAPWCGQRAP